MPRWFRPSTTTLALIVALASPAVGQSVVPASGALTLERIREEIDRGQWTRAATDLDLFLSSSPQVELEAEARYLRAVLARARGDTEAALADVQTVRRLAPALRLALDALHLEGELLYATGRYGESAATFGRFIDLSPTDPRVDDARWYRAEALAQADSCGTALALYGAVIDRAGSASLAQRALHGRAWCRRREGDESGARVDFERAASGPDATLAARSRFEVGASLFRLGQYEDALRWLEGQHGPADGEAARRAVLVGQSLFALERRQEALPHLEEATALVGSGGDPSVLYQVGRMRLENGDPAGAEGLFRRVLSAPGIADSLRVAADYALGVSLLGTDRFQEATEPLERVREAPLSRWGAEARYSLAYAYHRLGDYARSQAAIDELRALYPDSPLLDQANLVQGSNLFRAEQYQEAIGAYQSLVDRGEGDRADALFRMGITHVKLGEFAEAERTLQDLILRYPTSPHRAEARFWRAEALYRQGRREEAREAYELVRATDPDGPRAVDALYGLAWCDYAGGNYEQAAERFTALIGAHGDATKDNDTLFRRGNCNYKLHRYDAALADYERVLESDPEGPLAARALLQKAWSLHRLERFSEAEQAFELVAERQASDELLSEALYGLGSASLGSGQYARAAERFERAAAMTAPSDSLHLKARLGMAESYFKAGDYNRAGTQYEALAAPEIPGSIRRQAYEGWTRSLESAGRTSEAQKVTASMSQALPESETSGEALYRIGLKKLDSGLHEEGIDALRKYIEVGTPAQYLADAGRRCAEASLALGDKLRAAEFYRQAAPHADASQATSFRFEAGRLFYEAGKYAEARDEFDGVLRLDPPAETRLLALFNHGLALKETGALDEAMAAFDAVSRADGVSGELRADALLERGLMARKRGQKDVAKKALCEAARAGADATAAEAQYWCAEVDFEAGRLEDAMSGYRRIATEFGDRTEWVVAARYRMAEVYERLDRWAEAREEYEKIVSATDDEAWRADAAERLAWIKENPWVLEKKAKDAPSGDRP